MGLSQVKVSEGQSTTSQQVNPSSGQGWYAAQVSHEDNCSHSQGSLQTRNRGEVNTKIQEDLHIVDKVRAWGRPNVFGARIKLKSCWNFDLMESLTTSVADREVIEFLKFGWPVNYSGNNPPITLANHGGALKFKQQVRDYIVKELEFDALLGPFCSLPWSERVAVSPMTTRPKKGSQSRRVITDLSWGPGGVSTGGYLGIHILIHQ